MAELFQIGVGTANHDLKAIFAEGELAAGATIRRYRIVQIEGGRDITREVEHYNLDAVLAVGFRVCSHRGTQFRQWAIGRLNEYLVKGFTMDDERLKNPPGKGQKDYFDEQLNRIVNAYIEFSELRALKRKVMTMRDWIVKLDEFLKLSEHELLDHAGKISAEQAKTRAEIEYGKYRALLDTSPRAVDSDFEKATQDLKELPKPRKPRKPKP